MRIYSMRRRGGKEMAERVTETKAETNALLGDLRSEYFCAGDGAWKSSLISEWAHPGGMSCPPEWPSRAAREIPEQLSTTTGSETERSRQSNDEVLAWLEFRKKNGRADPHGVVLPSNFVLARSRSRKFEQPAKGERHSSATSYFDRGNSNSAVGNLPALGVARDNNGGGVFQNIWDANTERASPLEVPSARFYSTAPLQNGRDSEIPARPATSIIPNRAHVPGHCNHGEEPQGPELHQASQESHVPHRHALMPHPPELPDARRVAHTSSVFRLSSSESFENPVKESFRRVLSGHESFENPALLRVGSTEVCAPEQGIREAGTPCATRPSTSSVHSHGRIHWESSFTAFNLLNKYPSKGKISLQLSSQKRQALIIDDRMPMSSDMLMNVTLALPPKKMPSIVGVRERERERAERELAEISERFLRDRAMGGPDKRRKKALGMNARSLEDLRMQLDGVEQAMCPTCEATKHAENQHYFDIQTLFQDQESWEQEGCFGDPPFAVCRHNHRNSDHSIITNAAENENRQKHGQGRKHGAVISHVPSRSDCTSQVASRSDCKPPLAPPRSPRSPMSAWGIGDSTTEILRNMQGTSTAIEEVDKMKRKDDTETKTKASKETKELTSVSKHSDMHTFSTSSSNAKTLSGVEGLPSTRPLKPGIGPDEECEASRQLPTSLSANSPDSRVERKKQSVTSTLLTNAATSLVGENHQLKNADRSHHSPHADCRNGFVEALKLEVETHSDSPHADCRNGFVEALKLEIETQSDELLRQKLEQLEVVDRPLSMEDEFPFDPDAEIVRHFGREMRLASVRAIIQFMVLEILHRYHDTNPSPLELLNSPEKFEWVRKWIRSEGNGNSLKFVIQSNIGGGCAAEAEDGIDEHVQTKISFLHPDPVVLQNDLTSAARWHHAKSKVRGAAGLHWSRRVSEKKEGKENPKEKMDSLVFRQFAFMRINPLGVRGPKDVITL